MEQLFKYVLPENSKAVSTNVNFRDNKLILEVELEYKPIHPKDGDFIVSGGLTPMVVIYKSCNSDGAIVSYAGMSLNTKSVMYFPTPKIGFGYMNDFIRYATEDEKKVLEEELIHRGKRWNPISRYIEDIPKFGDIVKVVVPESGCARDYMICIYPNKDIPNTLTSQFFDIANINLGGTFSYTVGYSPSNMIFHATEQEKKELLDTLKRQQGLRWNPITKKLEKSFPLFKDGYYYIDSTGVIQKTVYTETPCDNLRISIGNCFAKEEEAVPYRDKMIELFKK